MAEKTERKSITATYDSRETGARYHVTSRVDDQPVVVMEPIADPFVRHTVTLGWRDLLRGLLRRRLAVTVIVGGDRSIVDDVMELDANCLIPGSARHREWHASLGQEMARFVDSETFREITDGMENHDGN